SALDARGAELAEMWGAGELSSGEWRSARDRMDADRVGLMDRLAALPAAGGAVFDPSIVAKAWDAMNLDERRAVVGHVVGSVTVAPAKPGTRTFDPGRVAIRWANPA